MSSDATLAVAEGALEGVLAPSKSAANNGRTRSRRGAAAAAAAAEMPPPAEAAVPGESAETAAEKAAARARDNAVTARLTKTKMCHFFERGKCASSDCRYAHSQAELRSQPNLEKTKLCKTFVQDGYCNDGENCGFAHGEGELRVTDGIYKTQMCHFFERGRCLKGDRCNHAHGKEDLRVPLRSPMPGRKGQGASSAGMGYGHDEGGNGAGASGMGSAGVGGGMGPAGLRSPLSPLPLAELLGDTGGNVFTNTPGPPPLPAGLHSPDLFLWTGMPWSPPAYAMPLTGQSLSGMGQLGNPSTPMGYQGMSPAHMGATAPPPGMAAALGGLGLGLSPAPGLAPATVGGVMQGGFAREAENKTIVCDLNSRLASLDVVVNGLAADVRGLNTPAVGEAAGSERLVHRI